MDDLGRVEPARALDLAKILELANKAYFLYVSVDTFGRAKLLRTVLSNCRIDAANLYPTYRKPFELIQGAAEKGEWYARRDSNSRPLAS